jgi:mono/diheme cytochrome c family protein
MVKCMRSLTLGLVLGALSAGASVAQDYTPPKGDAANGEKIFLVRGCYSCHGSWGQGTGRDGPKINPPPAFPVLLQQLRTPRREMPPYVVSEVSDQQAADIYAYLASRPKPPDYKSIPALQ